MPGIVMRGRASPTNAMRSMGSSRKFLALGNAVYCYVLRSGVLRSKALLSDVRQTMGSSRKFELAPCCYVGSCRVRRCVAMRAQRSVDAHCLVRQCFER